MCILLRGSTKITVDFMDRRVSLVPRIEVVENRLDDTFSDPVASQPTQLLQHALAPAPQNKEHSNGDWDLASPKADGHSVNNFSLDSRVIPARSVTPRYHLQDSLLQSLAGSGERRERVLVKDSQEEKHQKNRELVGISTASSDHAPAQGSGSDFFHLHGDSPISASIGKVIGEPLLLSSRHPCIQIIYFVVSRHKNRILSLSPHHPRCPVALSTNKVHARREQVLPSFPFLSLPRLLWWPRLAGSGRTISCVNKTI